MKNIYVIASTDQATIQSEIKKIFAKFKDIERVNYDLSETEIERVIEDLDTYNFLSSRKGVVATNASFLSTDKIKSEVEHNIKFLEKYIENPNLDNILIFVVNSLDKRKKIVTTLLNNATLIEKELNIKDLIQERLEEYKMDLKTQNYLIEYCGNNNERVLNEIEKLKTYKLEEKEITISDINEIVIRNMEDNIFNLVDNILKGNKQKVFAAYQDLLLQGEQPASILSKLANKIRLIYQVKVLAKVGKSDQEIGKSLNIHPYPVKLARESSYNYTESMLTEYLEKLAQVDYDMKSGSTTAELSFEIFMASI